MNIRVYEPLARRFADSYRMFSPGSEPHEVCVIGNGGPVTAPQRHLFDGLPVSFHQHDNRGRDLGAFQLAAETIPCDLMVCFGSPIHFWRAGWLDRIVDVFLREGPAMFGPWGFYQPAPHLRTTCFWLPPELLRAYPFWIGDHLRYEAEHGKNSLTAFTRNSGFPTIQVTWSKVLDGGNWENVTREDSLFLDQHCDKMGWK